MPLTSPARTLLDLAGTVPEEDLEPLVEEALRRKIVSGAELRRAIAWAPARTPGARLLSKVLGRGEWSPESQSKLEHKALELFRRARLPRPECQYLIADGSQHLATVDFAWPAVKLAVEAEGFRFHSGRRIWESDLARYNDLVLHGWGVLRLTWNDVHSGADAFVAVLRRSLEARSAPRAGPV